MRRRLILDETALPNADGAIPALTGLTYPT